MSISTSFNCTHKVPTYDYPINILPYFPTESEACDLYSAVKSFRLLLNIVSTNLFPMSLLFDLEAKKPICPLVNSAGNERGDQRDFDGRNRKHTCHLGQMTVKGPHDSRKVSIDP